MPKMKKPSDLILEKAMREIEKVASPDRDIAHATIDGTRFIIREILNWIDAHHMGKDKQIK